MTAHSTFAALADSWATWLHSWHMWQMMPPPGSIVTGPAANRMARVALGHEPVRIDFKREAALLMVDDFLRQSRTTRARKMKRLRAQTGDAK